jgi:hypothetical protein
MLPGEIGQKIVNYQNAAAVADDDSSRSPAALDVHR